MAASITTTTSSINTTAKEPIIFRRSFSGKDLCHHALMKRSYSDNHLCCSIKRNVQASTTHPKLKNSRSMAMFNFPNPIRSFLFDPETSKEINMAEVEEEEEEEYLKTEETKRANWVERLLQIRSHWREKKEEEEEEEEEEKEDDLDGEIEGCEVDYGDDNEEEEEEEEKNRIDRETFRNLLRAVSWSDTKLFAKLAFLCNMAYVIPEIKATDLRRYYGLEFVTSSLEKKAEVVSLKEKIDQDSTRPHPLSSQTPLNPDQNHLTRPSVAYEIAASAASYVRSRAKDLLSLGSEEKENHKEQQEEEVDNHNDESSSSRVHKSEVAAYVAASTMTAVVAAGEKQKQEAARDLRSLHSAPCEWFVCDDSSIYTRCFVIQGSESLASWQANLFFEPTKFEGTDVLVHRGIYEAAKGIYEQFLPEITDHLNRYGERAKLQFTGHSLGGSLSLLVNLMLLTRKVAKPSSLLPVVTFGSPFVFCGGQKIFDELGLDENHVHCVMMHRDIVPRAFSCNYPEHVAQVLKRLSGTFRSHPCLNKNKFLYSPMGKMFILQPDENSSPPHPLLPHGISLYALENTASTSTANAVRAFLNSPHPLETLSDPTAYGSDGTILRDHDSSNYLKAVNGVIRQHTKTSGRKERKQRNLLWPLLASQSPHAWSRDRRLVAKEVMTGV